ETLPCLVVSRLEKIPLKDFSSEIRANLDIERFLKEATLLLDLEGDNIESIIDRMLQSIFKADIEAHGSNHHHHHHNQHHQHPASAAQADQAATSTGAAAADGGDPNDAALEAKVQEAKKTLFLQASWMDYS
uniref:Magnesium transporter n=1 Tax=Macrostomum lignano TaxID=282301 RepID=A0A1I8HR39_9PLAT